MQSAALESIQWKCSQNKQFHRKNVSWRKKTWEQQQQQPNKMWRKKKTRKSLERKRKRNNDNDNDNNPREQSKSNDNPTTRNTISVPWNQYPQRFSFSSCCRLSSSAHFHSLGPSLKSRSLLSLSLSHSHTTAPSGSPLLCRAHRKGILNLWLVSLFFGQHLPT